MQKNKITTNIQYYLKRLKSRNRIHFLAKEQSQFIFFDFFWDKMGRWQVSPECSILDFILSEGNIILITEHSIRVLDINKKMCTQMHEFYDFMFQDIRKINNNMFATVNLGGYTARIWSLPCIKQVYKMNIEDIINLFGEMHHLVGVLKIYYPQPDNPINYTFYPLSEREGVNNNCTLILSSGKQKCIFQDQKLISIYIKERQTEGAGSFDVLDLDRVAVSRRGFKHVYSDIGNEHKEGGISAICIYKDSKYIVVTGSNTGVIKLWDRRETTSIHRFSLGHGNKVFHLFTLNGFIYALLFNSIVIMHIIDEECKYRLWALNLNQGNKHEIEIVIPYITD